MFMVIHNTIRAKSTAHRNERCDILHVEVANDTKCFDSSIDRHVIMMSVVEQSSLPRITSVEEYSPMSVEYSTRLK
jgi:hypothetical protein